MYDFEEPDYDEYDVEMRRVDEDEVSVKLAAEATLDSFLPPRNAASDKSDTSVFDEIPNLEINEKVNQQIKAVENKMDRAIDESTLKPNQKIIAKQIEHAIIEGDSASLAKALKDLSNLRAKGDDESAKAIEDRVAKDFEKGGLHVRFDPAGSVELNDGHPWGIVFNKDGSCHRWFFSGELSAPGEVEEPEAGGAVQSILRSALDLAQRRADERRTREELKYMGKQFADKRR